MKFAAALLLFAQFANADGHAEATTMTTNGDASMDAHSSLDAHLARRHQQLHMAISMVEKFCTADDSATTDDDGDDPNDTTDNDGNTDGDNDIETDAEIDTSIPLFDQDTGRPNRRPTEDEIEQFHSQFEEIMQWAESGDAMALTTLEDMKQRAEMLDISLAQHYPEIWLQEKLAKTASVLQDRGINRELCMQAVSIVRDLAGEEAMESDEEMEGRDRDRDRGELKNERAAKLLRLARVADVAYEIFAGATELTLASGALAGAVAVALF